MWDQRNKAPQQKDEPATATGGFPREVPGFDCPSQDWEALPITQEAPGRYRRLREYARGGMGRILLVRDEVLGRDIALKELLSAHNPDAATAEAQAQGAEEQIRLHRFLQEACITGQLAHPGIVPVYDIGRRADGTLFYTMKFVHGRTLDRAIEDARPLSERLGLLRHFLDVCQAVAYAHNRGVVHRDIKPSNIMIGEFGETVLLDWGIARARAAEAPACGEAPSENNGAASSAPPSQSLTRTGQYLGTPQYMAPEQARGDHARITPRTDVYALGAVLYELLTGQRRFEDDTPAAVLARILSERPAHVRSIAPAVPAELAAICEHAMRPEPADRYADAAELAEEIQRFQTGALVRAHQYSAPERIRRFLWRHRRSFAAGAAALVVVVAVTVFAFLGILQSRERAERALYLSSINLAKASIDRHRFDDALAALAEAPAKHRHIEWRLLHEQAHPEVLTLAGHEGIIHHGAYSPDGTTIATCGVDGRLILWDAQTGAMLKMVDVDEFDEVHRLDWSPSGKYIATATRLELIDIREVETMTSVRGFAGYMPKFSPDSKHLAAATAYGKEMTVFDIQTGAVVHKFTDSERDYLIWSDFSHDGRWLAAGNNAGTLYVWDLAAGALAWSRQKVHTPSLRHVQFTPDDRLLVTAGKDNTIRVWDTGARECIRTIEGWGGGALTPGGRLLLACNPDREVSAWEVATGKMLWKSAGYPALADFFGISPDGKRFVTNDGGTGRAVYPVKPKRIQRTLSGHSGRIKVGAFNPDGSLLATGGDHSPGGDNRVLLWDTATGERVRTIETPSHRVAALAFCNPGNHVAVGSTSDEALLYDAAAGELVHRFPGHSATVRMAVSGDGRILATASGEQVIQFWSLPSRRLINRIEGDRRPFAAIALNPTGTLLATGGFDHYVRVRRVPDGKMLHAIHVAGKYDPRLAFSPNGRWLATGTLSGDVHLWEVKTWDLVRTFRGHVRYVRAIAFNHDSTRMATGGRDNSVRLWDVATGEQVLRLDRHTDVTSAVAFAPGDKYLFTGSRDGTGVLWPIAPPQAKAQEP